MSDIEDELAWLLLHGTTLPHPEREYRFAPPRRWRFDFAWPESKVAVEVEGGRFVGGAHISVAGLERDVEKYNEAALAGWRVIRVFPEWVRDGRALTLIERAHP